MVLTAAVVIAGGGLFARPASAQPDLGSGAPVIGAVEVLVGHAAFVDDSAIQHSVFGVSAPLRLSEGLYVGPELLYMIGPGSDRDLILSGSLRLDLLGARGGRAPRVVPFVVLAGGVFFHRDEFVSGGEGYFGGGGGARIQVTARWHVAPEVQIGWEPHIRTLVRVGYSWTER